MSSNPNQTACADQLRYVTSQDLPLSCPMDGVALWNAHPKVYLPIEETGSEVCPYCGTHYVLKND